MTGTNATARTYEDKTKAWLQEALDRAIEMKGSTWAWEIKRGERLWQLASDELMHRALQQMNATETKEEETPMQPATARHENATNWQHATLRFAATFGMETLNAFFDCPTRERFAFAKSLFQSRPLAASILYAIDQSIINANDTHGHAVWSQAWDDCFGATLSMYLDDWSMIEYSGLARLDHDVWPMIGDQIQSYGCNWPLVKEETLAKIELDFWQTETALALDVFRDEPANHWKKADLLEIAEKRDLAFKRWVQDAFSKANDNLKGMN